MTPDDLSQALRDAQQEILDLQFRLAEYEWVEAALRKRTVELSERVKELECLHDISRCLCRGGLGLAEKLQEIVNLLPRGYQDPKRTWAQVEIAGESYCSPQFQTAPDFHDADIIMHGRRAGALRVWVLAKLGEEDEPPILPMERALLKTVALWVSKTAEQWVDAKPNNAPTGWWAQVRKTATALIRQVHGRPIISKRIPALSRCLSAGLTEAPHP